MQINKLLTPILGVAMTISCRGGTRLPKPEYVFVSPEDLP
jgi:hypothetical protein